MLRNDPKIGASGRQRTDRTPKRPALDGMTTNAPAPSASSPIDDISSPSSRNTARRLLGPRPILLDDDIIIRSPLSVTACLACLYV